MYISFVVTIDPVKGVSTLDVLIHSLNLQTKKEFNVIFYYQTLMDENQIFSKLSVTPAFDYQVFSVDRKYFLGEYPKWDLYAFHNFLLENGIWGDYFMSLHMEELLDVDYVENAKMVLKANDFDIMFGNLSRTHMNYRKLKPILATQTAEEFDRYLKNMGMKDPHHWAFNHKRSFYP